MPLIIDGWNFIRDANSPLKDEASLEAARSLISRLETFQATHRDPIVLVFDSKNEFLGVRCEGVAGLKVVAAADADDYIRRHIEKTPPGQRRNTRVVSSDRRVYHNARLYFASAVKCEEFWKKLKKGAWGY